VKVLWSPLALDRVSEVAEYISQDRPIAARQWAERIFSAVERLREFPLSGRVAPEVGREEVREVIEGDFRIIYRVELEQISVLTIRHTRQATEAGDIDPKS
jgi:toxin ParE1/3/4